MQHIEYFMFNIFFNLEKVFQNKINQKIEKLRIRNINKKKNKWKLININSPFFIFWLIYLLILIISKKNIILKIE